MTIQAPWARIITRADSRVPPGWIFDAAESLTVKSEVLASAVEAGPLKIFDFLPALKDGDSFLQEA